MRVFIVCMENSREREFNEEEEKLFNKIVLNNLHFLIDVKRHIPEEEN